MSDEDNRPTRASQTREKTKRAYKRPQLLPEPDPIPGWRHKWVRREMMGQTDPRNMSMKLREGWEPVKPEDYPELELEGATGVAEVGGLVLCKMPEEEAQEREKYFHQLNRHQVHQVAAAFTQHSDPRMPILNPEIESTTSYSKKKT